MLGLFFAVACGLIGTGAGALLAFLLGPSPRATREQNEGREHAMTAEFFRRHAQINKR